MSNNFFLQCLCHGDKCLLRSGYRAQLDDDGKLRRGVNEAGFHGRPGLDVVDSLKRSMLDYWRMLPVASSKQLVRTNQSCIIRLTNLSGNGSGPKQ